MNEKDIEIILEKAKPLVEYIEKELTMHHTIIVSQKGIKIVIDEMSLPKGAYPKYYLSD